MLRNALEASAPETLCPLVTRTMMCRTAPEQVGRRVVRHQSALACAKTTQQRKPDPNPRQYTWSLAPATNTLGLRGITPLRSSDETTQVDLNKVRW